MTSTHITAATWGLLLTLGVIWGGSFLAIRIALDEIDVFSSVAHRVLWAAIFLWIVAIIQGLKMPRGWRVWGAFLVMGLLNNIIPFTLMTWGQLYIETGLTAILNAATAIWAVLVAALVFPDERLTARRLAGVVIGFLGVATAIGLHNLTNFDLRSMAQIAVIAGTVSYAFAGSWARATLRAHNPLVSSAGMLTASAIVMVPLAWILEGPLPMNLSLTTWAAIGYYALISTALAYLLYYKILAAAGAGNLLLVTLLVAPVAMVLGALVRDEALTTSAYAGFALLALGLLILDGRVRHVFTKSARP